jgi:exopolysaccharide biosynthesis polyprenyl glycosylphosphotransferase
VLLLNAALLFGALLALRAVCALVLGHPAFRTRVLMLGHGQPTRSVGQLLRDLARHDYEVVGVLDYQGTTSTAPSTADELIAYVERTGAREVIIDPNAPYPPAVQTALLELGAREIAITSVSDVYELLTGRTPLPSTATVWASAGRSAIGLYGAVKRVVDVAAAVVGLVVFAPVMVVAGVAVVLDSPGHPLYWQERVGRHGRTFRMIKLRTMRQHAEHGQPVWARDGDPRVTRVGGLLRRSRLDEVPQLWNVLFGEMSLIGPRPERPEFVSLLGSHVPLYRARHAIRPGITGWAQVQFGYAASIGDATTKLQYDLYYIRHRSAVLDTTIVLKTLLVILRLKGT